MEELDHFRFRSKEKAEWVFASTYGLFNIGICNYNFILRRAEDFVGIKHISKENDMRIEQGFDVCVENKMVPPLQTYSIYTLAKMCHKHNPSSMDITQVDMYGINAIEMCDGVRWMSYIASLGIYKFYSGKKSYSLPIYCHPDNHVRSEESFHFIKGFAIEYFNSTFVPMIPYSQ